MIFAITRTTVLHPHSASKKSLTTTKQQKDAPSLIFANISWWIFLSKEISIQETQYSLELFSSVYPNRFAPQMEFVLSLTKTSIFQEPKYQPYSHALLLSAFQETDNREFHKKWFSWSEKPPPIQNRQFLSNFQILVYSTALYPYE